MTEPFKPHFRLTFISSELISIHFNSFQFISALERGLSCALRVRSPPKVSLSSPGWNCSTLRVAKLRLKSRFQSQDKTSFFKCFLKAFCIFLNAFQIFSDLFRPCPGTGRELSMRHAELRRWLPLHRGTGNFNSAAVGRHLQTSIFEAWLSTSQPGAKMASKKMKLFGMRRSRISRKALEAG